MPARTLTPKPSAPPPSTRAVVYARVSSKEQEKEGYSIPAQLKLLKDYAAAEGFTVAKEYVDLDASVDSSSTLEARLRTRSEWLLSTL